jgi:hypothetical protein
MKPHGVCKIAKTKLEDETIAKDLCIFWWNVHYTSMHDSGVMDSWHMNGHEASLFWQHRTAPLYYPTAI